MRQRLHGNAASRAASRPPPAPRSGQEAEPGSPSRPSSQQAGPQGRSLVEGVRRGLLVFLDLRTDFSLLPLPTGGGGGR